VRCPQLISLYLLQVVLPFRQDVTRHRSQHIHNPSSAPFTLTRSRHLYQLRNGRRPKSSVFTRHVQRLLLGLALYAQEQTHLDPRPPTKLARKAINYEPSRNSKLKCDRYVFIYSFFFLPKKQTILCQQKSPLLYLCTQRLPLFPSLLLFF